MVTNPSDEQYHHDGIDRRGYPQTIYKAEANKTMTNPDNVGGLRLFDSQWVNIVNHDNCYRDYTKEEAVAMAVKLTEQKMAENVELCRAAPAGMVLVPREIVANYRESTHIPRHRRICDSALAAPAGGDVAVGEIGELNGTKLIVGRDEDALARLPKGTKLYTRPQDSAPAGSGEVDALVGRLYAAARHVDLASKKLPDAFNGWEARDIAEAAALLRKLQQGAE